MRRKIALSLVLSLAAATAAAEPPAPGAGARIAVDRESHDFGVARQQETLSTQFEVRNAGDGLLTILDVESGCACSTAVLGAKEVAPGRWEIGPGGSMPLKVTLNTLTWSGPLVKTVRIRSNDPQRPLVELRLKVDVSAGVVVEPARLWFGTVLVGTAPPTSLTAKWKDGAGKPFKVTGVEAPGLDLAFEVAPFEAPPWHGWTVTARFSKPPPVGRLAGTAIVRTDHPDYPRIDASVWADVSGRVWIDRREMRMGFVKEGKGRTIVASCRGIRPDVDLGEVTVKARAGRVAARAIRSAGNMREWVIEVSVPETAPPGKVDDVVEVTSSLVTEPPALIAVTGEVLPGEGKSGK